MAPGPFDSHLLLWTVAGTAMCSAAANSFNQVSHLPNITRVCVGGGGSDKGVRRGEWG